MTLSSLMQIEDHNYFGIFSHDELTGQYIYIYIALSSMVQIEGRKEICYLTTHSQHILFTVIRRRTYRKAPLSERGNPLPPHGLPFPINSKGTFICTIPRQDSAYHDLCYISLGALAGTRNSQWVHPMIRRPIAQ